jgi:aminoglycoside phosphotransferase (APT) family kinase protein
MNRVPDGEARRVLRRWTRTPQLLGEGMEGAVYTVDDTRVAKMWFAGSTDGLRRTTAFYDALAATGLTFAVPQVEQVDTVDGWTVSIERRLSGATLATSTVSRADAYAIVVGVTAELAATGGLPAARDLVVLDEDAPLYAGAEDFPAALAALAARRVARFRPVLSAAVDLFDAKAAALAGRLRDVDSGRRAVIHGDLVLPNILVDEAGRASAVLDWGFLSTEGDPAFEAAVTAAIFDMYGPRAQRTEQELLELMRERMGYDHPALLVYRAAYSLITANAFDPAGRDGHFAWCVEALNRPAVTRALLG